MGKLQSTGDYTRAIIEHILEGERGREWFLYFDHPDGRSCGKIDLVASSGSFSLRAGAFKRDSDRFYLNYLKSGSWAELASWLQSEEAVEEIISSIDNMALRADED